MRTACNLKFYDSYGAARSDLNFKTSSSAHFNPARQSGDGCVEYNLIYERAADILSHKFSRSGQHDAKIHAATQRLVKFSSTAAQL